MSNQTLNISQELYAYLLQNSLRESPVLQELREETMAHPHARMQISPEQGQFMALLVELTGARRILEIGTFTGYSALAMAQALPQDGMLECCDISREYTDIARRYFQRAGLSNRIRLHIGPALETLDNFRRLSRPPFDMAFIDADKESYRAYYEKVLPMMVSGGLIMFDNTLWGGGVIDENDQSADTRAIREFNQHLLHDERISLSMVPIGDGLTLARKR